MLPKTIICDADIGRYLLFRSGETITKSLLTKGDFEPAARQLLSALFPDGDAVVIDVGSNVGTFAIPAALHNLAGKVYAFEAQRIIYYQLCANIILNQLSNVHAVHAAIGNPSNVPDTIDVPAVNLATARNLGAVSLNPDVQALMLKKNKYSFERLERTAFLSLDSVLPEDAGAVDFIKIDVEGMELEVLTGARKLIERDKPIVFFETWVEAPRLRAELALFFQELGYLTHFLGNDALAIPHGVIRTGKRVKVDVDAIHIE